MSEAGDLASWLTAVWDEIQEIAVNADGETYFLDDGEYTLKLMEAMPPASVLARIAADRKILALHARVVRFQFDGQIAYGCDACKDGPIQDADYWPCGTVLALLERHADRPDHPESWAVQ
jgi:hypothetical protein